VLAGTLENGGYAYIKERRPLRAYVETNAGRIHFHSIVRPRSNAKAAAGHVVCKRGGLIAFPLHPPSAPHRENASFAASRGIAFHPSKDLSWHGASFFSPFFPAPICSLLFGCSSTTSRPVYCKNAIFPACNKTRNAMMLQESTNRKQESFASPNRPDDR